MSHVDGQAPSRERTRALLQNHLQSIRVQGPDPEPKVNEKIPTGFTGIIVLGTAIAVLLISTGGNT